MAKPPLDLSWQANDIMLLLIKPGKPFFAKYGLIIGFGGVGGGVWGYINKQQSVKTNNNKIT